MATPARILEFLDGKKTYISAILGLLYLGGTWIGWWPYDDRVLAVLGMSGLAFLRSAVRKGPAIAICFLLSALCVSMTGCQTALATKVAKDGTADSIQVKSFLGKISQGSYSNGTGMTLSVESATPDQQSIATLAGAVTDIAKLAVLAGKIPTNAIPISTNSVPQ